jgi:GDP-D-mannose dehydratase
MIAITRQAEVRGVPDEAHSYTDYVLGTGQVHHVWELVDRSFALAGFALNWELESSKPTDWSATFADSGELAVIVDPALLRPADPQAIGANPSKVIAELGWTPVVGLDTFLEDMLTANVPANL